MKEPQATEGSVLSELLTAVRSYDGGLVMPGSPCAATIRAADFYGSPFLGLGLAASYPDLPLEPDLRWDRRTPDGLGQPTRYPPHVTLERGAHRDGGIDYEDFDVLSTWPLPGVAGVPTRLVIFLETLRCIAAPMTDADVERLPAGMLSPGRLPKGYLSQAVPKKGLSSAMIVSDNDAVSLPGADPFKGTDDLQRRLFRQTFLTCYMHVLLRKLAAVRPGFVASVVNTVADRKRAEIFETVLASGGDDRWKPVVRAAAGFIRRSAFRALFLEPCHFLEGLDGLNGDARFEGPASLGPADADMRLPETLAALINVCIERTGEAASLYPDLRGGMHVALDDAARIERASEIVDPGRWHSQRFVLNDRHADRGPSLQFGTWASLCMVFEGLLAGRLVASVDESASSARGPVPSAEVKVMSTSEEDSDAASSAPAAAAPAEALRLAKERLMTDDLLRASHAMVALGRSDDDAPSGRFVPPEGAQTDEFEFYDRGLLDVDEDLAARIRCVVQRAPGGAVPPGTIWLPIPRHFADIGVDLDVKVYRYIPQTASAAARLQPLDIGITDDYLHAAGTLFTLEPRYWDDQALPAGFGTGDFDVLASLGLVGTADRPDRFLCIVVCIEKIESGDAARSATG